MDNRRCSGCGGLLSVIGESHYCRPRGVSAEPVKAVPAPAKKVVAKPAEKVVRPKKLGTYQYRDPVKRRLYIRDKMRAFRAKKKLATSP